MKGAWRSQKGPQDIGVKARVVAVGTLAVEGRLGLRFGGGLEAMVVALGGCLVVDEV